MLPRLFEPWNMHPKYYFRPWYILKFLLNNLKAFSWLLWRVHIHRKEWGPSSSYCILNIHQRTPGVAVDRWVIQFVVFFFIWRKNYVDVACTLTTLSALTHFWQYGCSKLMPDSLSKHLTATRFIRLFKIVVVLVIFFPNIAFFVTFRNKIRSLETEGIITLTTIGPGSSTAFLSFKFLRPFSLCSFMLVYQLSG